jgi:hypothetical protein
MSSLISIASEIEREKLIYWASAQNMQITTCSIE